MLSKAEHSDLLAHAFSIKKRFLAMYKEAKAGHIGCSLSCAEILTFIQFGWKETEDEIILSKGHAAAALYSILAESGALSEESISTFYKNNTILPAHPPANAIKEIPFATGSLGHGLSLAAGIAMAAKFKQSEKKIFCISSDGELNEGSIWEAAQFITMHNLKNVVWFIDNNGLQGFGTTDEVMGTSPLDAKISAYGFEVIHVDGHDMNSLQTAKEFYAHSAKPLAIICKTIKGKGWAAFEDKLDCHYLPFNEEQYLQTMEDLEKNFQLEISNLKTK